MFIYLDIKKVRATQRRRESYPGNIKLEILAKNLTGSPQSEVLTVIDIHFSPLLGLINWLDVLQYPPWTLKCLGALSACDDTLPKESAVPSTRSYSSCRSRKCTAIKGQFIGQWVENWLSLSFWLLNTFGTNWFKLKGRLEWKKNESCHLALIFTIWPIFSFWINVVLTWLLSLSIRKG